MYVRKAVVEMGELIVDMQKALIETAEKYSDVIMPGYTHLHGHNLYYLGIIWWHTSLC